ncbi:MAG: alpha/beta hydrolase [Ilumatobacteraceae bacterium]
MTDGNAELSPVLAGMLAELEKNGSPPETRPEATTAALVERYPALAPVMVEPVEIDGPHGPVEARVYRNPELTSDSGLVWVHGGAWVSGILDNPEAHWVSMAIAAAGIPVLSVEYRKALNGVHFPVPSDDVLAAYVAAPALLGNPGHVHIGGASAGANLAAGVTKRLRDGAGPLPASMVLAYGLFHPTLPEYSDELTAALTKDPQVDVIWRAVTPSINLNFVGDRALLADPYAFPANGELAGLPPTYEINSEVDSLRASGEEFARQLAAASVEVVVETEPGTGHGHFDQPTQPQGERSLARIVAWIRAREAALR